MGAVPTANMVGLSVSLAKHTDGFIRLVFSGISLRCFPAVSDFFAVHVADGDNINNFVLPPGLQTVKDKRIGALFQLGCTTALAGYGALKQTLAAGGFSETDAHSMAKSLLPSSLGLQGHLEAIPGEARAFCKKYQKCDDPELRAIAEKISAVAEF
jgi:hypothetical protein